jgi:hypothetical protein
MRWAREVVAVVVGSAAVLAVAGCGDGSAPADAHGSTTSSGSPAPTAVTGTRVARVKVPGSTAPVVLTRDDHGRGGYQLHLYVELPDGARELTDAQHNPVIPFVATDTRPATPVSADCTGDGFAVTEAQPTKPAGVMFAWDVRRTSYTVTGDQAVPLRQVEVGTSVPDRRLRTEMPALFARTMFAHC